MPPDGYDLPQMGWKICHQIHELHFFTAFRWVFSGFSTSISGPMFGSVLYLYLSYAVWTLQYVNTQRCSCQLLKYVDVMNRSDVSIRIGVLILAWKTMDGIVERIIPVSLVNTEYSCGL